MRTQTRLASLENKSNAQGDIGKIPQGELEAMFRENLHSVAKRSKHKKLPWLTRALRIYDAVELPEPSKKSRAIAACEVPVFDPRDDAALLSELDLVVGEIIELQRYDKH